MATGGVLGWLEQEPGRLAEWQKSTEERDVGALKRIGEFFQQYGTRPAPYGPAVGKGLRKVLIGGEDPSTQPKAGQAAAAKKGPVEGFSGIQGMENLVPKMADTIPKPGIDISTILQPYINELSQLGPEYQAEMDFLKPYLAPAGQTFQQVVSQSQADMSPTGSKSLAAAESNLATAMENQPKPGFGQVAQAAKQFEGTIPYSQVLQTVLEAGKNQILGYSTVPNLTNLASGAARAWSPAMQAVLPYLEKSIGYTSTGIPNANTAAIQAGTAQGIPASPGLNTNLQGGGSTG